MAAGIAAAIWGLAAAAPAQASVIGFTGPFDPGQWTVSFGPGTPQQGTAVFDATKTQLTITGGNSGCDVLLACEIIVSINRGGPIRFHWDYDASADSSAPQTELFGIIVDGTRIQVSDPGSGLNMQTGDVSIVATSSFGFFHNCTDCIEGAAITVISDFAVPEPGSLALLTLGLGFLGIGRKLRG